MWRFTMGILACLVVAHDPATATLDEHVTSDAEGVDHYRLVSDDRRHAVEIQVFDSGRTDVLAVALLTPGSVEELWPAGG